MNSLNTIKKNSKNHYFQNNINKTNKLIPKKIKNQITYKKNITNIIFQIINNLHSKINYIKTTNLQQLHNKTQFIQINNNKLKKSHPHNIQITKKTPNYSIKS